MIKMPLDKTCSQQTAENMNLEQNSSLNSKDLW